MRITGGVNYDEVCVLRLEWNGPMSPISFLITIIIYSSFDKAKSIDVPMNSVLNSCFVAKLRNHFFTFEIIY